MLVKLLPNQIIKYWDLLKPGIGDALQQLDGNLPERLNEILGDLLIERMQCWVYVKDENIITALVTALMEGFAGDKNKLVVYAMYAFEEITDEDWIDGFATLSKFALSRDCEYVVGNTDRKGLAKTIERLGGEMGYSFSIPCVH